MPLTSEQALEAVLRHFESLFPRTCSNCGRPFATLQDYIQLTTPIGLPVSFDAELDDWTTREPIGSLAQANCQCGSTLALGTDGMATEQRLALLDWLRLECQQRRVGPSVVLDGLRTAIRAAVLAA